jgi:DNA-binding transcriptional ArsR family regulator
MSAQSEHETFSPLSTRSDESVTSNRETSACTGMMSNMRCAAEEAAGLLSAIGSSYRLLILCSLMDGEKTVSEICSAVDLRQSTASQHLSRLRLDGLVSADRRGRFVVYALAESAARDIISILYRHFCVQGHDVVACHTEDEV